MTKETEREVVRVDNSCGGEGYILRERLMDGDDLGAYVKTFAKITVPAGCSIGYHQHEGDFETYYLVAGQGEYSDNGALSSVGTGDVLRCAEGDSHSIKNTGDDDLVFIALIVTV